MRGTTRITCAALRLLRPGGAVIFNGALATVRVARAVGDTPTSGDRAGRVRVVPVIIPLGDGLLAAVKRGD